MSVYGLREVPCPACGTRAQRRIATTVNVVRSPAVREAVLDGSFHRFTCARCGTRAHVETELGYLDADRGHWIAVHPADAIEDWQDREALSLRAWWRAAREGAPAWLDRAITMRVRVCFGLAALVEKLHIWEDALDDGLVEVWKQALAPDARSVRYTGTAAERAHFRVDGQTLQVPSGQYQSFAVRRAELLDAHPALFKAGFVDRRRLYC